MDYHIFHTSEVDSSVSFKDGLKTILNLKLIQGYKLISVTAEGLFILYKE